MTTTVVVKANHGWPVTVMQVDPKNAQAIGLPQTVEAGTERSISPSGLCGIVMA
jgi:hypothetical protein